jgi:hypothetical protein
MLLNVIDEPTIVQVVSVDFVPINTESYRKVITSGQHKTAPRDNEFSAVPMLQVLVYKKTVSITHQHTQVETQVVPLRAKVKFCRGTKYSM